MSTYDRAAIRSLKKRRVKHPGYRLLTNLF